MTRIDTFFKPPRFEDEEKTRQAFLLHVLLWTLIIVPILFFVFALLFSQEVTRRVLIQVFVGLVVNVFLLIMLRRGYVRSASIIQVAAFWVFFTATAWTAAGVQHQAYQIGYALVIFIAGFLIGMRGTLIIVGVSLLSGGLMVVASDMGLWSFKSPDKALNVWVVSAILFPLLVVLQYLGGRLISMALAQSRKSEAQYRLLADNMKDQVWLMDLNLKPTYISPSVEKSRGYTFEEIAQLPLDKQLTAASFQSAMEFYSIEMSKALADPTYLLTRLLELEFYRKDGSTLWLENTFTFIRDETGKPLSIMGVGRDITERKQVEDALKKNQEELIKKNREIEESRRNVQLAMERLGAAYEELKTSHSKIIQQEKMASIGQLAAGVAHKINNPMAFIASNLGTLDKYIRRLKEFIQTQAERIKSLKPAETGEKIEKKRKELKLDYIINDIDLLIKESIDGSERIQKIVQELNRFSRIDDEEYKDADINECIESSINIVWNELKHKATLHKDYGNLPLIRCYPQKLNQVFINLLINAIQAIEEKGEIKIKTWEKAGSIWVTVSDTGCGIPQENQSKIFEPFYTTKEAGRGTGLGLSISYEIIQRHKGEISFKSKEGKGTTFNIRMPIV